MAMLLITKDGQRSKVLEILRRTAMAENTSDWSEEEEDYVEAPNKVYIDGDVTFDQMAEIVDFLRDQLEEKK